MLTQAELKAVLRYEPETGNFYWIKAPRNGRAGDLAGSEFKPPHGRTSYVRIKVLNRSYFAHRLAWLYVNGCWPNGILDHMDTNGMNNRFLNLRPCTNSQNTSNCRTKSNNRSGVKNVHWETSAMKWRGTFCMGRKGEKRRVINVGLFDRIEEAAAAVHTKRMELHGEFANHG